MTKGKFRLKNSVQQINTIKADVQLKVPATLGATIGGEKRVQVPTRDGYVYACIRGNLSELVQAYNAEVSPVYGLPVILARDKVDKNRWIVLERDLGKYPDWGTTPYLPFHGPTHSFNPTAPGGDPVWIYSKQIMPLSATPSGSAGGPNVIIQQGAFYNDGWILAGITGTANITPYNPTGSNARMVLVYLDSVGNPQLLAGSYLAENITGTSAVFPYIPAVPNSTSDVAVAGIRLVSGTSIISWANIYDLRTFGVNNTIGNSAGHTIQDDGVSQTARTNLNFVGSDFIVYDNAAGDATIVSGTVARAGHVIQDDLVTYSQRTNLQFSGGNFTVTDDSVNNATVITSEGGGTAGSVAPMGFVNPSDVSIAFLTNPPRLQIGPAGGSFQYWNQGLLYERTDPETITITGSNGTHYVYLEGDTLYQSDTEWDLSLHTPVATVFTNDSLPTTNIVSKELYGSTMDPITREWIIKTKSAHFSIPLSIAVTDTTFTLTIDGFYYADKYYTVPVTGKNNCLLLYRDSGMWKWEASSAYYKTSAGIVQYDNAEILTAVAEGAYSVNWMVISNELSTPIFVIVGQEQYLTLNDARAAEYTDLTLYNLPCVTHKPIYKLISQRNGGATNFVEYRSLWQLSTLTELYAVHNHLYQDILNLSAGGHIIQDSGVDMTQRTYLNFLGSGFDISDNPGANSTVISGTSTGHTIQDDGVDQTSRSKLNFVGPNFVVYDDSSNGATVVSGTSSGLGHTIQDDGVSQTDRTKLNFVGSNFLLYDDAVSGATIVSGTNAIGGAEAFVGTVLLDQSVTTTGTNTSFNISVSEDYAYIKIFVSGKSMYAGASFDTLLISLNSDTTDSNYRYIRHNANSTTHNYIAADARYCGAVGSNAGVASHGLSEITIPSPSNTSLYKSVGFLSSIRLDATNGWAAYSGITSWENTNAITNISIVSEQGVSFAIGTRCTAIGYKQQFIGSTINGTGTASAVAVWSDTDTLHPSSLIRDDGSTVQIGGTGTFSQFSSAGLGDVYFPYGQFSDSTTQTSTGTSGVNLIKYDTDENKFNITHSTTTNPSRIQIDVAGTYLITYSACVSASLVNKHINIWLRVNGVDVARSNTITELPISGESVLTVTYIQTFTAGQYFELVWCSVDDAAMILQATAAGVTPTRPASPSIIVTVNKVSR